MQDATYQISRVLLAGGDLPALFAELHRIIAGLTHTFRTAEIAAVESGERDRDDNVLKNAPHTAEAATADALIVRNRTQVRGDLLAALARLRAPSTTTSPVIE